MNALFHLQAKKPIQQDLLIHFKQQLEFTVDFLIVIHDYCVIPWACKVNTQSIAY
jgi:hypothetical protein